MPPSESGGGADLHVVGIGASAGGLKAIEELFEAMPTDTGAAFVVVQHLSPDFKSHMAELLSRKTRLAVQRVEHDMPVEPNTVYLIPPRHEMAIANGRLLLTERDRSEPFNLPIDHFFRSLAHDCGRKSIGVVLSGTGSDGSRGIVEIDRAGGLVLCQDEGSAEFDGMPINAQETNSVHLVLHPLEIAHAISTYISQSLSPESLSEQELVIPAAGDLDEIVKLLRRDHGIDFSLYKPTTVRRRIERRLSMGGYASVSEYVDRLRDDGEELNSLYKDLLIGVTQFFRDPEAFDAIRREAIPAILESKQRDQQHSIRVWVAGCATGEEPISLAILFHEALQELDEPMTVKIFATDAHRQSLATASAAVFPASAVEDMSEARIERYFVEHPDGYELAGDIRKMIVFAPHNLISDAPFTRLDLVSCRNLLIYFQPALQKKTMSLFHFSLRTAGYLLLGPSETPGDLVEEFNVIDRKWRLYQKRRDVRLTVNPRLPLGARKTIRSQPKLSARGSVENNLLATYDQILDRHLPPSFLVDERFQVMHTFGGAERYLQIRGGRPSMGLLELIHDDLKTSVSAALQHAGNDHRPVSYTGIRVQMNQTTEVIGLTAAPFVDPLREVTHLLVTLESSELPADESAADSIQVNANDMSQAHIATLEKELRYTKENLQATVEELETSNEELQATNEELVASNEEMQSTNEELQSVNEELYTVNAEHQQKISELTELTNDMDNLFRSTEVGVIFLDSDLRIRRFTPKVADTFSLLPQDIGRPIDNFAHTIEDTTVFDSIRDVLESGVSVSREVRDHAHNYWLLKIGPYRADDNESKGVVLTLVDLNPVKESDAKLDRYREIVSSTDVAIIRVDRDGTITDWNQGAARLYGRSESEMVGQTSSQLFAESQREDAQRQIEAAQAGQTKSGFEYSMRHVDGDKLSVLVTFTPLFDFAQRVVGVSIIGHDYSQRQRAEKDRQTFQEIIDQTSDFVGTCDLSGNTLMINPAGQKMLGFQSSSDWQEHNIAEWHPADDAEKIFKDAIPTAIRDGVWRGNTSLCSASGERIPLSSVVLVHRDPEGNPEYLSTIGRDISRQIEFEQKLEHERLFLRRTLDGLFSSVGVLTPDGVLVEANQTFLDAAGVHSDEVLGRPFEELVWWSHSRDVQVRMREAIERAAAGNESRFDVDIRLAGGNSRTIDFQLKPLLDDHGRVTHLIPSGIDITDRVEMESEMRVFRRAFHSSLTAMVITDARREGNPIIYVNPGFTKLTGYSAEEAIGRNCRFLQGAKSDPEAVSQLRDAISQGESCRVRILNYRKSGQPFSNELVITPVRDHRGIITHFVGVQFDMTDYQRAERELVKARDLAEKANAAKSSFVANISHEIRTPLTTVVGMADMLLEQEADAEKQETLKMIQRSGNHLVNLINDVLDLSKIEAGRLEAELVECSPIEVIREVVESVGYRAANKGLRLEVEYHGLIPDRIHTDPIRLRQILFNLAGNAVKFTDQGSVTIGVQLVDRETEPQLQIDIRDTGVGFDVAETQRLFEQFSQVDQSPARKQGGSGLGLYISQRIAELLNGRLEASSQPGEGSLFSFYHPVDRLDERRLIEPEFASARQDNRSQTRFDLRGRVLVVEDTRGIQILLKRILERAGATVTTADDGVDALELVTQGASGKDGSDQGSGDFDVILLDMHMPRLSGYDFAQRVRDAGIPTPILALTASALRGDKEKCLSAGCSAYLTKPIDRQKLLMQVSRLLGQPPHVEEAAVR